MREQIGHTGQSAPVFGRDDAQAGDWIEATHALPEQGIEVLVMPEAAHSPSVARREEDVWRRSDGKFIAGVLLGDLWSFIPDTPPRGETYVRLRELGEVRL